MDLELFADEDEGRLLNNKDSNKSLNKKVCRDEEGENDIVDQLCQQKMSPFSCRMMEVEDFKVLPGNGLTAKLNGALICGGNMIFASKQASISDAIRQQADRRRKM